MVLSCLHTLTTSSATSTSPTSATTTTTTATTKVVPTIHRMQVEMADCGVLAAADVGSTKWVDPFLVGQWLTATRGYPTQPMRFHTNVKNDMVTMMSRILQHFQLPDAAPVMIDDGIKAYVICAAHDLITVSGTTTTAATASTTTASTTTTAATASEAAPHDQSMLTSVLLLRMDPHNSIRCSYESIQTALQSQLTTASTTVANTTTTAATAAAMRAICFNVNGLGATGVQWVTFSNAFAATVAHTDTEWMVLFARSTSVDDAAVCADADTDTAVLLQT